MASSIECKNFLRSLQLLNLLVKIGVQNLILCPGSRSAPLAIAAGELNKMRDLRDSTLLGFLLHQVIFL